MTSTDYFQRLRTIREKYGCKNASSLNKLPPSNHVFSKSQNFAHDDKLKNPSENRNNTARTISCRTHEDNRIQMIKKQIQMPPQFVHHSHLKLKTQQSISPLKKTSNHSISQSNSSYWREKQVKLKQLAENKLYQNYSYQKCYNRQNISGQNQNMNLKNSKQKCSNMQNSINLNRNGTLQKRQNMNVVETIGKSEYSVANLDRIQERIHSFLNKK